MEEYRFIERTADMPAGVDFAVIISGDEMEPTIFRGETIFASRRVALNELDIGLFLVDGQVLCRRWCEDYSGALLLICDNPDYTSKTISFPRGHHQDCICLGKVLLSRKK